MVLEFATDKYASEKKKKENVPANILFRKELVMSKYVKRQQLEAVVIGHGPQSIRIKLNVALECVDLVHFI